jgi:methionine-rich copper-binding protein CopC
MRGILASRRLTRWAAPPLACLALILGTVGARAHANAVRSTPAVDAVIADSPAEVAVWFDAAIDPARSGLALRDRAGRSVVEGSSPPSGQRDQVTMPLPPLQPGTYTVVWHNVSAEDGHANGGYYSFSVGRADPPMAVSPATSSVSNAGGTIGLTVTPQDDGRQHLEVTAVDNQGRPIAATQRVFLRFRLPQPDMAPSDVQTVPVGDGRYVADTGFLSMPSAFNVEVVVRRRGVEDLIGRFTLQAAPPASPTTSSAATGSGS